jgi:hypothetical protein
MSYRPDLDLASVRKAARSARKYANRVKRGSGGGSPEFSETRRNPRFFVPTRRLETAESFNHPVEYRFGAARL